MYCKYKEYSIQPNVRPKEGGKIEESQVLNIYRPAERDAAGPHLSLYIKFISSHLGLEFK